MSVHVTSWVLKHSEESVPGRRLVLLVLADKADHDGTKTYPAVETIAREARMSERGVRYALRALEKEGRIERLGLHPTTGTYEYRVVMREEATDAGGHAVPGGNEAHEDVSQIAPYPSNSEPSSVEVARTRAASDPFLHCFAYWQERTGHQRAKPTADLRRKFQARLAEGFTVDDVRTGIDGIAVNGYVNERGVKHDDFELVVRNGEKLRLNIARASAGSLPANVRELPQNSTASERRQANEKRQMEILMRQAGMST